MSIYHPDRPYNDLPLLPPELNVETRAVLKQTTRARSALAELKGRLSQLPNAGLLLDSVVLQEARTSSEVENIVTTQDELFRAAADPEGAVDHAAKEVLRYREAMWKGFYRLKQGQVLSTRLFEEIYRTIKLREDGIRRTPGTKIGNVRGGETIYTPPEGERVIRDKLANLENFLHETELDYDPLVKMAMAHYQFEAVHPFPDGNGRTGRILNILYLVDQGLIDQPVLYLSRHIIENKKAYYDGLRLITETQAWEPWILYMLQAVETTARQTLDTTLRITELMTATQERIRQEAGKIYSKELVELLFQHPYCKIRFLEQAGLAKRQTSAQYLKKLSELGILSPYKAGREIYFINTELLKLLRR